MYFDFPCVHKGNYMKSLQYYYLITLGYHIYQLYRVFYLYLKGNIKNDWAEMTLHHLLTICLYVFSYVMGFVKIGSLIMFLHDWVDIWSPFTKIFVETHYDKLTVLGAVNTWTIWIYSRLIVFPQIVYFGVLVYPIEKLYPNYLTDSTDRARYDNSNYFVMSLGLFLTFLIVLHIYWFHMLTGAIFKFASKGKIADP